jgi:hypothetical protein
LCYQKKNIFYTKKKREKMKITIHRALSELKLMDARIQKQTNEILPVGMMQKGKLVNQTTKEEEFNEAAISKFDSIIALIERKNILKSAVVEANAVTFVVIADKKMSIADAINFKTTIKAKKELIENLKQKHRVVALQIANQTNSVEANLQKIMEATFGKDNVKVSKEDVDAIRKPFLEANEWKMVDPLKITSVIEKMEKEIESFEVEVDAVLSEINAVTFIEV